MGPSTTTTTTNDTANADAIDKLNRPRLPAKKRPHGTPGKMAWDHDAHSSSSSSDASFSSPETHHSVPAGAADDDYDNHDNYDEYRDKRFDTVRNSFALPSPPPPAAMDANSQETNGDADAWLSTQPTTARRTTTTTPKRKKEGNDVSDTMMMTATLSEEIGTLQQQQTPHEAGAKRKRRKVSMSPTNNNDGTGDVLAVIGRRSPRRHPQTLTSVSTTKAMEYESNLTAAKNTAGTTPTSATKMRGPKNAKAMRVIEKDVDVIELMDDDEKDDDHEGGSVRLEQNAGRSKKKDRLMKLGSKVQDVEFAAKMDVLAEPPVLDGPDDGGLMTRGGDTSADNSRPKTEPKQLQRETPFTMVDGHDGPQSCTVDNQTTTKCSKTTTTKKKAKVAASIPNADIKPLSQESSSSETTDLANGSSAGKGVKSKLETKKAKAAKSRPKNNETKAALPTATTASSSSTTTITTKKKKKKKKTFEDELLHKLFVSCRPHTVKELMHMMDDASEATVQFCLLSLTDKQWVLKKEFGSGGRVKELYWANQDCTSKELWDHRLDFVPMEEIHTARKELGTLQHQQKTLHQELVQVLQEPSNEELELQCQAGEQDLAELQQRLQAMKRRIAAANAASASSKQPPSGKGGLTGRSHIGSNKQGGGNVQPDRKQSSNQLKRRINAMRDEWRKRKVQCMDFVEQLADGMDKKVKDVIKVLELETDESEGVTLPPKHVI